jgi:membrane associated rhomboid family serine protease
VQTFWEELRDMPVPARFAVIGTLALGIAGSITGLVVGLFAYPPTAWAAVAEVGMPAAFLGCLAGFLVGVVVLAVRRTRRALCRSVIT